MNSQIQNAKLQLTLTLQYTIQLLGPLPNEAGSHVRSILNGNDMTAIVALGCYLEDCKNRKSYQPLRNGLQFLPGASNK